MLDKLISFEGILSLTVGGFMLYFPYMWCRMKGERAEIYGLRWFMTRAAWRDAIYLAILTLAPLTPIAVRWQLGMIPYDLDAGTAIELLSAGVAAAFIEETFFRGWLQTTVQRKFGPAVAIFVASLAFGATHLIINPSWLRLATFFPGLVMGWLRQKHGSIMPAIVYHALGNVWSVWFFPR